MDSCGEPVKLVAQNSEELNAIIAEIERASQADANPAPVAAAARPPPSSLYEEMLRFQEDHAEEALSLINGLQDDVESDELVRNVSVNSADDAKPAAFPQGVFRQPIARNYFARKSLIDSSSHSDMVPLSPKSDSPASNAAQNSEQGRPEYTRMEESIDNEYTPQTTELTSQTTADIINMLLENEKGNKSKNHQHSDQGSELALAQQLHDDVHASWSKPRQFLEQLDGEEMNLLRQLSGGSALVDGENDQLAEDRDSDDSSGSRRHNHNPAANGELSLPFKISQTSLDETKIKTYVSSKIQRANSMDGTSNIQSPRIKNSRQQKSLAQRGNFLIETPPLESFATELSAQPVRPPFHVEELSYSVEAISLRNDRRPGAYFHAYDVATSHEKSNSRGEVQAESARVQEADEFVDSTRSGKCDDTWDREGRSHKDRSEGSILEATRTTHAQNVAASDKAAEPDRNAKHSSADDTEFSTNWNVSIFPRPAVQTVRCHACFQNLQTPIRHQHVHCPVCGTISPCRE